MEDCRWGWGSCLFWLLVLNFCRSSTCYLHCSGEDWRSPVSENTAIEQLGSHSPTSMTHKSLSPGHVPQEAVTGQESVEKKKDPWKQSCLHVILYPGKFLEVCFGLSPPTVQTSRHGDSVPGHWDVWLCHACKLVDYNFSTLRNHCKYNYFTLLCFVVLAITGSVWNWNIKVFGVFVLFLVIKRQNEAIWKKKSNKQKKRLCLKKFFPWDLHAKLAPRKVDVSGHLAFLQEKRKIPR